MAENGPSSTVSEQGRRVLVAVVTGEPGARIQAWRTQHDPAQAQRIPPHTTLCYRATNFDLGLLGEQVRHAFPRAIHIGLGGVGEFSEGEGALYVEMLDTAELDLARQKLYDGEHLDLGRGGTWPWHITCVRYSNGRDLMALRAAARELTPGSTWTINEIVCLELRGERYEAVAAWDLDS